MANIKVIEKPTQTGNQPPQNNMLQNNIIAGGEVVQDEVVQGEFVNAGQPLETEFAQYRNPQLLEAQSPEYQQLETQPTQPNPMEANPIETVSSATLYQAAEQYGAAGEQAGRLADGLAGQAQAAANDIAQLERNYVASDKPMSAAKTTGAVLVGAAVGNEAIKFVGDNFYNAEKVAEKGLEAAAKTMGKGSNWNPLNWVDNVVKSNYSVAGLQSEVVENVTKVSGDNLGQLFSDAANPMINDAGVSKQSAGLFRKFDMHADSVKNMLHNNPNTPVGTIYENVAKGIDARVGDIPSSYNKVFANQVADNIEGISGGLRYNINQVNDKDVANIVKEGYESVKQDIIAKTVTPASQVQSGLFGSKAQIKDDILEAAGGMKTAVAAAKKDLEATKIGELAVGLRDKIGTLPEGVQRGGQIAAVLGCAALAYAIINHINEKRDEKLHAIEGQIEQATDKQASWVQKSGKAENLAKQSNEAAGNIGQLAILKEKQEQQGNWQERLAQQPEQQMAMGV